jgi:hypothetical protein
VTKEGVERGDCQLCCCARQTAPFSMSKKGSRSERTGVLVRSYLTCLLALDARPDQGRHLVAMLLEGFSYALLARDPKNRRGEDDVRLDVALLGRGHDLEVDLALGVDGTEAFDGGDVEV